MPNDRQGQKGHHDNRCTDNTGGRGHDRSHQGNGKCQTARNLAHQHVQAFKKVFGDPAFFKHRSHVNEHRHGNHHHIFGNAAPDAGHDVEEFNE